MSTPYDIARSEGYTDQEINDFLSKRQPQSRLPKNQDQKYQQALAEGYSPEEIDKYLESKKSSFSRGIKKAGRIGMQAGLGAAEMAALPYEISVAPLASEGAQFAGLRENIFQDIERLEEQKSTGVFDESDQKLLDELKDQIRQPEKTEKHVRTADLGIRGLVQKATGIDTHPEGILEKAANWVGFLKNPKNAIQLVKSGLKPKDVIKSIIPGEKTLRGLGAATALQMAEDEKFGPGGTLAAAIVGDIAGFSPKGIAKFAKEPKKYIAKAINIATMNKGKREIAKQIIEDAKKSGIQLDLGTLTQSNIVKMAQARAIQSGLSGSALDNFRKDLSNQIVREYEKIANLAGDLRFENSHQAGEAVKDFLNREETFLNIPKEQSKSVRSLQGRITLEERPDYQQNLLNRIAPQEFENSYQAGSTLREAAEDVKRPVKEELDRRWTQFDAEVKNISGPQAELHKELETFINEHEGSLLLGESAPEHRVLQAATTLLKELEAEGGGYAGISLRDLIKTKRTLGDVANWEFGGSNFESSYKKLVSDIDRAIDRTLERASPELRERFENLNADYSHFKDTFENKNVLSLFEPKNQNFNAVYESFITNPDKLRSLEDMFYMTQRGEQLINQIKRDYAQRVISRPNVSNREIRDLGQILGPGFSRDIADYQNALREHILHPGTRAARREEIGVKPRSLPIEGKSLAGRAKETELSLRSKLYDSLKNKTPEQIAKEMNTIEGIRKLKRVLSLTPEGQKLFGELARFKLSEIIDKNLKNNITEQAKLGTFSGLLKSSENKAIVKELLGEDAFDKLVLLQKNSGRLAESAGKFFNASQSGTAFADMARVSGLVTGVLMGNPYIAVPAIADIAGLRLTSYLLSDVRFLKHFEEAVLATKDLTFKSALQKMKPSIEQAQAAIMATKEQQK
jgi:hypothetical protein